MKTIRWFKFRNTKYVGWGILDNSKYGFMCVYRKLFLHLYIRIHREDF